MARKGQGKQQQPNKGKQGAGAKTCNTCGKTGHVAKGCLSNKNCGKCGKAGHLTADCRSNNQEGRQDNQYRRNQGGGGAHCNFCNKHSHTEDNCYSNPARSNYKGNKNQDQNGQYQQHHMQDYIPLHDCQVVPFSDPCQLCGQNTHYAKDCPTRGIIPTVGQYFPQTYPAQSWVPVPAPVPQDYGLQWGNQSQQVQNIQQPSQIGFGYGVESIGEEVSTRPSRPASVQWADMPRGTRYRGHYGYVSPEIPCERPQMRDRDGDFIMGNSWECADCRVPSRDSDNWSWRWPNCSHYL